MSTSDHLERDQRWLRRMRARGEAAFERLFLAYYEDLCRFASQYVSSPEVVEDLVQDIFFSVWKRRHELDPQGNVRAYLYKAARNEALKHFNQQRARGQRGTQEELQECLAVDTPERALRHRELEAEGTEAASPSTDSAGRLNMAADFMASVHSTLLRMKIDLQSNSRSTMKAQVSSASVMTDRSTSQYLLRRVFQVMLSGLLICALGLLLPVSAPAWGQDQATGWQESDISKLVSNADVGASYAQPPVSKDLSSKLSKVISLYVDGATLEQALRSIAEKGDLDLIYGSHPVLSEKRVALSLERVTVQEALREATQGTGLEPVLSSSGQLVLVNQAEAGSAKMKARGADFRAKPQATPIASLAPLRSKRQQGQVTGTVTDSLTGEPLPGVNVVVVETQQGAASNAEGNYTISGVEPGTYDVAASFVGYASKTVEGVEVQEGEATAVDFALVESAVALDEVVAIGYGEQRRSDLTGAVGTVSAEDLQQRPVTNVEENLSGRVPGVDVAINSGRPGGAPEIRVRGVTSVSNTNDPVYVVDGVMLNVEQLQGGTHPLSSIDPNSIESIEVLKDASATAIYGARGANGVVLITTKRGARSGGTVNYDTYISLGQASNRLEVLNAEEFLRVEEIAYENASKFDPEGWAQGAYTDPQTKRDDPRLFDENGNPLYDTDWQDEAFQNAISHNHALSFTGGDENRRYGIYLGYRDEQGVMKDSWLNRYSGRFVMDANITEWLTAGGTLSYNNQSEKELHAWSMRMLYESIPIVPVRYPDGTWAGNEDYPGMEGGPNQRQVSKESIHHLNTQNIVANVHTDIDFGRGISLRTMVAANIIDQGVNRYSGRDLPFLSRNQEGIASLSSLERDSWQFENLLTYDAELDKHSIDVLLGQSIQTSSSFSSNAEAWGFVDDYFKYNNLGVADNPRPGSSSASEYSLSSFFSRLNYTYDSRYLLTVTGRIDGSSKFGRENRYGFFPSAALGWRISEEEFMQDNPVVSSLKLRASVGQTGNSEIPNYQGQAGLGNYTAIFSGSRAVGVGISRLANPNLRWETNTQVDLGLEMGLLNNRLLIEADVYRRVSSDMLMSRPVPTTSGYSTVTENIGSMENRGVELSLTTYNVDTDDFLWSTTVNWSANRNEVLKLHGGSDIFAGGGVHGGGAGSIIREGYPVNTFMGYIHLGTWNTDEADEAAQYNRLPGDIKYEDVNGDGQINQEDQVPIGNGMPDGWGTVVNSFAYKNLELTVDIQFNYGNDVMWEARHSTEDRVGIANSLKTVLDAWTPDNQDTPIAQLRPTQAGYDTNNDTHRLEDGSFIRGRNVTLSYNVPAPMIERLRLNSLRLYASGQNLFTITSFPGYDPEVSTANQDFTRGRAQYFEYPKARTFTLGMNMAF